MAESSFRKGFGAGCGFIAAALFVFVVLPLGACIVFGVYGSFDRAVERATGRAALSAACTVSASEGQCVFTNTGDDAGASCVTVVLRHRESGESIASRGNRSS